MKRKVKVKVIANSLAANWFGTPLHPNEYRWLAEHIVDALRKVKKEEQE